MNATLDTQPRMESTQDYERDVLPRIILGSGFQPDYVREVANAYARIGKRIQVVGGDMHAALAFEDGVTLLNYRGNDKRETSAVRELLKLAAYYGRLLRFVAASPCPVVYDVSIGRPLLRCLLMYSMFRLLGKRIIYTAHNILPHDGPTLLNRIIYRIIYRALTDAIIVHGQTLKERLIAEFQVAPDKVHVISHGTYHPPDERNLTRAVARDRLGLPHEARVALFFGLQRPYKGTEFALQALCESPVPGLIALIRGDAGDPVYRERLMGLIRKVSLHVTVDARLEPVPEPEMELLFKASDIVVLPYLEGSQSGIQYMAYAYGRPVLASAIGSLGEFIVPGLTGETFPGGDASAFVTALRSMVARLEDYDERRIKSTAYTDFSFEAAVRRVDSIFEQLRRPAGLSAFLGGSTP
ncbi:MAG: glycosyltransferase family 4 protein [Candidatus Hydrogenedentes bacterium]|nr:glycosyltransferase family 4 protein [Candidatus Hydrogenedentota bacterium]